MFSYCENNPVNMMDKDGYIAISAGIMLGSASLGPIGWIVGGFITIGIIAILKYNITKKIESHIQFNKFIKEQPKNKAKSPNLPSYKKLKLDMDHIMSGHSAGGNRGGPNKDRFPGWMKRAAIQKAIKEAYNTGKKLKSQGDRVFISGFSKTYNTMVKMWVNIKTKVIESAWPK